MKIYEDLEQKSQEWLDVRKGKITASKYPSFIFKTAKGLTQTGLSAINELVAEKYACNNYPEKELINYDIIRGNELEPICRQKYADETWQEVKEVGFIEKDEYCGCSPDGLVGEDGLLECKAPNNKNYVKYCLEDNEDWINQCKYQLYITGRKWCDLTMYNPNFSKPLHITRVELTEEDKAEIEKILSAVIEKYKEIEEKLGFTQIETEEDKMLDQLLTE